MRRNRTQKAQKAHGRRYKSSPFSSLPLFCAFCAFCVLSLFSCSGAPKTAKVNPPVVPNIPQHVEPLAAAVPAQLPPVNLNNPIDLAIIEAQLRFEKGEELYKQGLLKLAKDEFDG